jgi:FAD/FMN-containing dehydrogenase
VPNAHDVAESLALARRWGVRAAPRSGGHCLTGRSSTEGIVLLTYRLALRAGRHGEACAS